MNTYRLARRASGLTRMLALAAMAGLAVSCTSTHETWHETRVETPVAPPPPPPAPAYPSQEAPPPVAVGPVYSPAPVYAPAPAAPAPPPPPAIVVGPAPAVPDPEMAVIMERDMYQRDLEPLGQWTVVSEYGNCWRPHRVPADWQPYTVGHWVYTQYGWTWASEEPWGRITYHYGSWVLTRQYGWVWIPGRVWAPAWVAWRMGDGYVGWAPLPPEAVGRSIQARDRFIDRIPPSHFCFVEERSITSERIHRHLVPHDRAVVIAPHTRDITRIEIDHHHAFNNRSLDTREVERSTGTRVAERDIREVIHRDDSRQHDEPDRGRDRTPAHPPTPMQRGVLPIEQPARPAQPPPGRVGGPATAPSVPSVPARRSSADDGKPTVERPVPPTTMPHRQTSPAPVPPKPAPSAEGRKPAPRPPTTAKPPTPQHQQQAPASPATRPVRETPAPPTVKAARPDRADAEERQPVAQPRPRTPAKPREEQPSERPAASAPQRPQRQTGTPATQKADPRPRRPATRPSK